MTFEIKNFFDELIDEEAFQSEYAGQLLLLCKEMCKQEGCPESWTNGTLKLVKAEFI